MPPLGFFRRDEKALRKFVACAAMMGLVIVSFGQPAQGSATNSCKALADFGGTQEAPTAITGADFVAATDDLPAYCRVAGEIRETIGFEVRLPVDSWNEKFLFAGCGGACGEIRIDRADNMLARGYATAATDMGHEGRTNDFSFAYNNREGEIDFAYRATHLTTVSAKALIKSYYGEGPELSYFWGGSTGGRQALVEAERYPTDYDGIVVLYPGLDQTGLATLHLLWSALSNMDEDGQQILEPDDARVLYAAAVKRCDGYDGLSDGLIDDPRNCDFNPAKVKCRSYGAINCLTPEEVRAARKVYAGPHNSAGEPLTPGGPLPGSELNWIGDYISTDGGPSGFYEFGESFTQKAAYEVDAPTTWKPEDFDWDTDPAKLAYMEQYYTATNADLTTFRDLGGKMIMISGWSDHSVPPPFVVRYYRRVQAMMGGERATNQFFRYFGIPGMGHGTGPGGSTIGIGSASELTSSLKYLENWVEHGRPPARLTVSYSETDDIVFQRPVFPYPTVARYRGNGDPTKVTSFKPVHPREKKGHVPGPRHAVASCAACRAATSVEQE